MSVAALPSKLFDSFGNPSHQYSIVNHSILDHTQFLRNRNRKIYGDNYMSLVTRMKHTESNSKYIYANPYAISFIDSYMTEVYDYEFNYNVVETFEPLQKNRIVKIYKYEIE